MAAESENNLRLEIGHVLFIDLVGYSKLLIEEQKHRLNKLTEIVLATPQVAEASNEQLVRLPTGDGMALVFRNSAEEPAQCALQITQALKAHPEVAVRMGIHSGPVSEVTDVSGRTNITGGGINMAQRVMDCGDACHILLSKHVANDLQEHRQWSSWLHDLGECEVKHGVRLGIVNLYRDDVGNPQLPKKLQALKKRKARMRWAVTTVALLALAAIAVFSRYRMRSAPAVWEKSIAVLPFQNLSKEEENAFFADGVQDEILTNLAKIADLKVISRTSVMQYKSSIARNLRQIGRELGVAHILEGSVQRVTNKVRVNAQLIDARNDLHLWAQTYDRDLTDIFAIQSEIAKAIADQLQAKLSVSEKNAIERPPTADIDAFDLYGRAKDLALTTFASGTLKEDLLKAVDLLNQALARDQSFFAAQCLLAHIHDQLYFQNLDHTPARLALAEAALDAAFRLRPDAGEAHLARAQHLYHGHLQYEQALAELTIARRTLPNDPRVFELTGYITRRQGKQEEALHNLRRATELDPRNLLAVHQLSFSYRNLRRYKEESAVLDRVLSIEPEDILTKLIRAWVPLDWKGDTRPLHQTLDDLRTQHPEAIKVNADMWFLCAVAERDPATAERALVLLEQDTFGDDVLQFGRHFGEGLVARMTNDEAKARAEFSAARLEQEKVVQADPQYGPALCVLGLIDAGLGRKGESLQEGRRAMELLPLASDSLNGPHMIQYFAVIAGWSGEKDLALEHLAKATQIPCSLSYGQLKLMPWWDPLRGDPRFEKIVASLAPKNTKP